METNDSTTTSSEQSVDLKYCTAKAGEILQQGHKRFDRVFENEGGKIVSIHRDTMELCILKNEKTTIWEKLCLCCSPVSVSFFICIASTKEFNGESAYWAGFMTALAIFFGFVGILCGIAWYRTSNTKKPIMDAIIENCIGYTTVLKEDSPINNDVNPIKISATSTSNDGNNQ